MGWLAKIIESDRVKRAAISGLLLAQLTIMASQAVPVDFYPVTALHGKTLLTKLRDGLSRYATVLGLRQDWMMFAPNPMRENTFIDAEITYRSGRKSIWTFPQMQELGYAERYAKERYRKFANERLWVKDASSLWPDAARYIARLNREPFGPAQDRETGPLPVHHSLGAATRRRAAARSLGTRSFLYLHRESG